MSIKSTKNVSDQYIIKDLWDGTYKVIALKRVRAKHIEKTTLEEDEYINFLGDWLKYEPRETKKQNKNVSRETKCETDGKMKESLSRSKRIIWEYARCNEWEYFVTLLLDMKKIDRGDLAGAVARMGRMIWKINQSVTGEEWGRKNKIEYVIIPELHKDGNIHFHGLMRGFHKSDIRINEHGHPEWKQWRENFGFMNMQKVKSRERVCSYITKYVSKGMCETVKGKGLHAFYASHGLQKPYVIYKGYGEWKGEWDYVQEDGYCSTAIVSESVLAANFVPSGRSIC